MATTFKFGNGNWAVKEDYALAYNDENGNFKPLPFDFTRASSATRVNKNGLIETVPSGKPRIDFTDNTSGHLLLEPSRTNYSIYSEDTSTWTYVEFGSGSAGTITTGKTDMFGGTNAVQIDFPANAENVSVRFGHTTSSISSGSAQTSLYIKLVGSTTPDKIIQLRTGSDAENTTISGDSFVRYTKTHSKASNEAFNIKLRPSEGTSSGGFSIIVCHPQEEAGSYATSYIPTEGSSVTRVVDDADNSLPSNDAFNSSGSVSVLFNIQGRELTGSNSTGNNISFEFGSNNRIVYNQNGSNYHRIEINSAGSASYYSTSKLTTESVKIGVTVTSTTVVIYVNGTQEYSETLPSTGDYTTLDSIDTAIAEAIGNIKIKDLRFYNTPLSNTELQALTS